MFLFLFMGPFGSPQLPKVCRTPDHSSSIFQLSGFYCQERGVYRTNMKG